SQKVMVTSRLSGRGPGNERDSRGVHRGDGRDLPIVYVRKKPARMGGLSRWRSEVQGGGEPQAAAFFQYSTGSRSGLSVAGCPVGLPVVGIAVAFQEIRVQQVGNAGVQRQILSCFVGATQVEHAIGLDIADGVVQRPILVGQVGVLIAEACTLATVLALQPQAQAVGGVPVELGIQQMLGSLGQFVAFVLPTFLLAIGVGVIAAQCPAWGEPPTGGKLQALGDCFIDVDLRRTGAIGVAGAKRIGNRRATGDLVIKLVVEQGGVGVEANKVVVVDAEFGAGADFRLQVRIADADGGTLTANAVDSVVQVVQVRGFVAPADATLQRPVFGGVPHQIGARAEMASKGIMVVVTAAQGERQVVAQAQLVRAEQGPGGLLEILGGQAISHVGLPPLSAQGGHVVVTNRSNQLGVENEVRGLQLAVVAHHDGRVVIVGRADGFEAGVGAAIAVKTASARNGAADSFGGVVHQAAIQRTDCQTASVGNCELLAFKTQLILITVGLSRFAGGTPGRGAAACPAIEIAELTLVVVVDLAALV